MIDELFEEVHARLRDLYNRVTQLEAAPTVPSGGGSGGAPANAEYLVNSADATLTNEIVVTAAQGRIIYGDGTPTWNTLNIGTQYQLFTVNAAATLPEWASFDWDNISSAAGADMVHNHSTNAEGGEIPLASLGSYTQGDIIIGGAADWEDLAVGTQYQLLAVNNAGTEPEWQTFDWDNHIITAGGDGVHSHANNNEGGQLDWDNVWSDAVHNHSTNAEGGEIPLTSLSSYTQGDLIVGGGADWTDLAIGANNTILFSDGSDPSWQTLSSAGIAPSDATYIVVSLTGNLTNERNLNINNGLTATDGGANAAYTVNLGTPSTLDTTTTNNVTAASHTHNIATTSDGATNHSTILQSNASGQITMDDYFTVDGGRFGISGNELLTVNAAGTFAFSGITGIILEDADWIGNSAASARLGFDSSGATDYAYFEGCNVGIGTTSPGSELQIGDYTTTEDQYLEFNTDGADIGNYKAGLIIKHSTDNYGFTIRSENHSTETSNGLNILRHNNDSTGTSALWIERSTGNVGIGTTLPSSLLDVVGDIEISNSGSGIIHVDGNTAGHILRGDGTRYIPSAIQVGDLPAHASTHESGGGDTVNHDSLVGFVANEHINHTSVTLTAGSGLTGGGDISANRTFNVGAGDGITVNADDVALTTPGTLTAATANSAVGNHTHAITTSSNGTVNPSTIAAFNASGQLTASDFYTNDGGQYGISADTYMIFNSAGSIGFYANTSISATFAASQIDFQTKLQMNGLGLLLDADDDTGFIASSDDDINVVIAGAIDFDFQANTFRVLSGSNIDMADGASITGGAGEPTLTFDSTNNTAEWTSITALTIEDGDYIGIESNERLQFNAAGNITATGITSFVVPNGAWVGADSNCSWVFDSSNGDVTTQDNVGIGTTTPNSSLDISGNLTLSGGTPRDIIVTQGADASTNLRLEFPDVSTANANFFLFRNTNTSGALSFSIYRGNGTASVQTRLESYGDSYINALTGNLSIGTNFSSGQLHVDQSSSTGAQPVLLLDQGDTSEQCIEFSSDATDRDINLWTVNVTGAPALKWDESENGFNINKSWYINETTNSDMTLGITINQGASANEIFATKSSTTNHDMINVAEADTYGNVKKISTCDAGLQISGFMDGDSPSAYQSVGLRLLGYCDTEDTTDQAASGGAVLIEGYRSDGLGSVQALSNDGNVCTIRNAGTACAIFKGDGDLELGGVVDENDWDNYNDLALLHGLRASINPNLQERFGRWIEYAKPILEQSGIINYNKNGKYMLSMRGMQMLTIDAVRQLYEKLQSIELKCLQYEKQIIALGGNI